MPNERLDGNTTNSIGDDLRAAFRDTGETPAGAPETPASGGDIPVVDTPTAAPAATDGRQRDENGRFATKPDKPATETPEKPETLRETLTLSQKPKEETAAPQETVPTEPGVAAPPPGWSVASKTAFPTLPDAVKADIAKREQEISAGFKQYSDRFAVHKDLDRVIQPRIQELTADGMTVPQAIERLIAAGDVLKRDLPGSLIAMANHGGIDLAQLAALQKGRAAGNQPANPQQGQPAAQPPHFRDPRVDALLHERAAERAAIKAAEDATADSEISAFASDPKNVYFENVRSEMGFFLESGKAQTLSQAYQMACAIHPEISEALISERAQAKLKEQQDQQRRAASAARAASGSLTGAPTPGSMGTVVPQESLRGELEAAMRAHRV